LLFEARNAIAPSHTKSIQMWNANKTPMPANDHNVKESEISFRPIVNHQIRKNGFKPVKRMPARNAPCFKSRTDFCF